VLSDRHGFILCDELAMAVALDDRVVTATQKAICSVETAGLFTRGQMITHRDPLSSNQTTVNLVTGLDFERCTQLLTDALSD